jgi:hypothetical protein
MIAHLINTDVGNRGILDVYLHYREENPNFLHNSAKILLDNYSKVLIITGFPVPPEWNPETDGPPGALALYRAVERIGGKADIFTYPEVENALAPFGSSLVRKPDVSNYSLVVAIETPGMAPDGNRYSMRGIKIEREALDWAVVEATSLGIPTIGIGDGGNEAGMGKIRELVERFISNGEKIGSVIETDELIVSAVSNWGAYGLVAEASIQLGRNLLEDWDENKVVSTLDERGLIDGVTGRVEASVDGIPLKVHVAMVELLKALINAELGD